MNMKIYMNYTSIVKHILFKSEFFGYTLRMQKHIFLITYNLKAIVAESLKK